MSTLSSELRAVIEGRLKTAGPREIMAIVTTLCAQENAAEAAPDSFKTAAAADARPRFVGNTSDSVYDRETGLLWTKGNVGEKPLTWAEAKKAVSALNCAGHTDWRLP